MNKEITKRQKDASENLFKINPVNDKCLKLMDNGLLTLVPDDTEFTEKIGEQIVELVRDGETILEISETTGVAATTIFNWKDVTHPDYNSAFAHEYKTAYEESADTLEWLSLQEAIDKSGDLYSDTNKEGIETLRPNSANVQRSRLQVESMDKIIENRNPGKYSTNPEPEYGSAKKQKTTRIILKNAYYKADGWPEDRFEDMKTYEEEQLEKKEIQKRKEYENQTGIVPPQDRKIQDLKNGKCRIKPVETKHTKELGDIICHLTLMGHPAEQIAKAVGITRTTIQLWKNEDCDSYLPDFALKFDTAYRNSTELLFSYIRIIMNDSNGDMFADNKSGTTIMRPNCTNVQRSKLILDKLFRMIRVRQYNVKQFGTETMVIYHRHFGPGLNKEKNNEVINEAVVGSNGTHTPKQITA